MAILGTPLCTVIVPKFPTGALMIRCFLVAQLRNVGGGVRYSMTFWNPSSVLLCGVPIRYVNVGLKTPVGEIINILVTTNHSEISKPVNFMYL